MKKRARPECFVPRSIGLALWISRIFGIAPLRIVTKKDGYHIKYSPSNCVYGCVVIVIVLLTTVTALGFDLSVPLEMSIRMRSETRRVVWVADVGLVGLLSYVGAYYAPAQMRRLIDFVLRVQKINSEMKITNGPKLSDNQQYRNVEISLLLTFVLMVVDFATVLYFTIINKRRAWVAIMYSCYYVSYIIIQLLELQFILTVMYVLSSLRLINHRLKNLQTNRAKYVSKSTTVNYGNQPYTISVQPRSVNKIIDTLTIIGTPQRDITSPEKSRTEAQTVRRLSLSYISVCEIIREVNKNHGVILLLLLASFLLHLIVTLYYMITNLIFDHSNKWYWERISNPILQVIWCIFHTVDLVVLIEPCHRTHAEMEVTKGLIGNLMCTTSSLYDPLSTELELFSRNLMFNQAVYSPLQVCTLTRPLIGTVLGSMTTYLVVIVQL